MAYRSMRRSGGGGRGVSYRAVKGLINSGLRRARGTGRRKKGFMGIPTNYLMIAAVAGVAYWQRDKIKAMFNKPV